MCQRKRKLSLIFISAKEAYESWKASPESIHILDVRTPAEYIYVGHPEMAANIPYEFLESKISKLKNKPVMKVNEDFVAEVSKKYKKTDTIYIICRSGNRSARCADLLFKAGFTNVYNAVDGFEGDKLKVKGDANNGKRVVNGWKNAGSP